MNIANELKCTGCTACKNICPQNAISMREDEKGFLYPQINTAKCISCGLCEEVCLAKNFKGSKKVHVWAVKASTISDRANSQSGGAFYIMARHVISNNGVVYGAKIDEDFVVRHARALTIDEVEEFRGSKYVQSNLGETYLHVKKDLESKRKVLFSGTPCQIAGLKSFLRCDYDDLFLVDLICHGVPSPKVWRDYLEWQKRRHSSSHLISAEFRDRKLPWGKSCELVNFGNGGKTSRCTLRFFIQRMLFD